MVLQHYLFQKANDNLCFYLGAEKSSTRVLSVGGVGDTQIFQQGWTERVLLYSRWFRM